MTSLRSYIAVVAALAGGTLFAACEVPSADTRLGVASYFNLFVVGDLVHHDTRTEGRVAAGGSATFRNYSIGQDLVTAESPYALLVGGDLSFEHGSIYRGHVAVGGVLKKFSNWNIDFEGQLYGGKPLDFTTEVARLRAYSGRVAAMKATGKTETKDGAYVLKSEEETPRFVLEGEALSKTSFLSIETKSTASVVVTITGRNVTLKDFGFNVRGARPENTMFHFPEAETITLNRLGVPGSILAPNAAIDFREGNVQGNVVAASLKGNGHVRLPGFSGCLP